MFKDLFLGTEKERKASALVEQLEAQDSKRKRDIKKLEEARRDAKRLTLKRVGGGILLSTLVASAGVGGWYGYSNYVTAESIKPRKKFEGQVYDDWPLYYGTYLPQDKVLAIASDLGEATEYTGFPEAGELLQRAAGGVNGVPEITPTLTYPARINLTNLFEQLGAVGRFPISNQYMRNQPIPVQFKEREGGQVTSRNIYENFNIRIEVQLDRGMVYGPHIAKVFLIAKEISHIKYYQMAKALLLDELRSKFDITTSYSGDLGHALLINFPQLQEQGGFPNSGPFSQNIHIFIDWAGYWHTTPALGRILRQGLFSDRDQLVLRGNVSVFNKCKNMGLITEVRPGFFEWREDIGPFSEPFRKVMGAEPYVPQLIKP